VKKYQSIKQVEAEPMDYHTAGKLGLIRDYKADVENSNGYRIVYADGYESWSPKKVFEDGYNKLTKENK